MSFSAIALFAFVAARTYRQLRLINSSINLPTLDPGRGADIGFWTGRRREVLAMKTIKKHAPHR